MPRRTRSASSAGSSALPSSRWESIRSVSPGRSRTVRSHRDRRRPHRGGSDPRARADGSADDPGLDDRRTGRSTVSASDDPLDLTPGHVAFLREQHPRDHRNHPARRPAAADPELVLVGRRAAVDQHPRLDGQGPQREARSAGDGLHRCRQAARELRADLRDRGGHRRRRSRDHAGPDPQVRANGGGRRPALGGHQGGPRR